MNLEKGTFGIFPAHMMDELSTHEQLVLSWLWYYSNTETRECWPAQATLARKAGMGTSKLNTTLNSLEEKGLVKRTRRTTGSGGRQSTLYYVPIRRGDTLLPEPELPISTTRTLTKTNTNQKDTSGFDLSVYIREWQQLTGGQLPASRVASQLKKLEGIYGRPRVLKALHKYIGNTEKQYVSIHRFIQTVGLWDEGDNAETKSLVVKKEDLYG